MVLSYIENKQKIALSINMLVEKLFPTFANGF